MLKRTSVQRAIAAAAVLTLSGGVLLTVLAYAGQGQAWYGPWAVMLPVCIYMIGHGVNMPCSQSGAVAPFPARAGTASALNGFIMMLGAFGMGGWLGAHMDNPLFSMVHGMLLWSVCVSLIAWTAVQRHGRPVVVNKPTLAPEVLS
jgi:DHA1 family bicyclomycin/chloramphenicol resistance-like MFS transporter